MHVLQFCSGVGAVGRGLGLGSAWVGLGMGTGGWVGFGMMALFNHSQAVTISLMDFCQGHVIDSDRNEYCFCDVLCLSPATTKLVSTIMPCLPIISV